MTYSSLKDLGYQHASTSDTLEGQAQYAIDNIVGFPEDVPAEARAELYEGYRMRCNDNKPPVVYAVIDGHYVEATANTSKTKRSKRSKLVWLMRFPTHHRNLASWRTLTQPCIN